MTKDDDLLTSAAKAIGSAIGKVSSTLHIAEAPAATSAPVKPAAKKRSRPKKAVAKKTAAKKTAGKRRK